MSTMDRALRREGLPRHGETRHTLVAVETSVPSLAPRATIFAAGALVPMRYCGHCLAWVEASSTAAACPECRAALAEKGAGG